MAEGIDQTAYPPAMLFGHGVDLSGANRKRLREHSIRIRYGQEHLYGAAAQRLWTKVGMLRRFVTQPKLRTIYGQS
jgi:hypothetical protein